MNRRWALGSAGVVVFAIILLIVTNPRISPEENLNRPIPFLSGCVFALLVLMLMTIETPVDPDWLDRNRGWWHPLRYRIWRIYDPLTMVLYGFFFAVGTYLLAVYGGFSGRFQLDADAFDWARFVLLGASVLGFLVLPRLINQGWMRLTSDQRRRRSVVFGSGCYWLVLVGWRFHEVTITFAVAMVGLGTATIVGVWWWERRHGYEREVLS